MNESKIKYKKLNNQKTETQACNCSTEFNDGPDLCNVIIISNEEDQNQYRKHDLDHQRRPSNNIPMENGKLTKKKRKSRMRKFLSGLIDCFILSQSDFK